MVGMIGRKKKRNESISSLASNDSTTISPSITIPKSNNNNNNNNHGIGSSSGSSSVGGLNYLFGRFGNRNRTQSDDGASSPKNRSEVISGSPTGSIKGFFGRNNNNQSNNNASLENHKSSSSSYSGSTTIIGNSMDTREFGGSNSNKPSNSLFSRATTTSLRSRPSWLGGNGSPLTASPSSPALSLAAAGGTTTDQKLRNDKSIYMDSGSRLAALTGSQTNLVTGDKITSNRAFSRSVDELSRFPTSQAQPMTRVANYSIPRSSSSVEPIKSLNRQSLAPGVIFNTLSTSAPLNSNQNSKANRNPSPFRYGSQTSTPLPFPTTSTSTPDLSFLTNNTSEDRRRDSQTIVCQGFLQRKADYAPPAIVSSPKIGSPSSSNSKPFQHRSSSSQQIPTSTSTQYLNPPTLKHAKSEVDLQKGWKPYRVILKGSKLYLHKLPGDLTSTAKQLFPSTIVASTVNSISIPILTQDKLEDVANKKKQKRIFWGTTGANHHPDLIVGEKGKQKERVKGGTLEAFLHELVFASTFVEEGEEINSKAYESFMETLLLVWPFLPFSTSQSASELDRLVSMNRESDASSSSTLALAKRLETIVETICKRYPEDLRNPNSSTPSDIKLALGELVKKLESLSVPSPEEAEEENNDDIGNILERAFTGRPISRSIPPTEWTSSRPTYSRAGSSNSASSSPSKPRKQTVIDSELPPSLSASTFLNSDPINFASQINLFHLDRLNAITGQASTSRHILRTASIILAGSKQNSLTSLFSFSPSKPHFLTKVVLETIFDSTMLPPHLQSLPNFSAADIRSQVITHWIKVAEESRNKSDISAWLAIAFALCCRSIARLEETWRLVDEDLVDLVRREWAPVLNGLGFIDFENSTISPLGVGINRSGGIPYFGSILEEATEALRLVKKSPLVDNPGAVDLVPFYELREKLNHLSSIWIQEAEIQSPLSVQPNGELQFLFQTLSRQLPQLNSQLRSYLTNSLEVEPNFTKSYPSMFNKVKSSNEPSPLLPLIMVEPLPYISLIDKERVINLAARAIPKKQSSSAMSGGNSSIPSMSLKKSATSLSSTGSITPDYSRPLARHNSYPPSTLPSTEKLSNLAQLRNEIASNPTETLIRFGEGALVFRIVNSATLPIIPQQSPDLNSNKRGVLTRNSSWIESKSSSRGTPKGGSIHESGVGVSRRGSRSFSTHSIEPTTPKLQVAAEGEPVCVVLKAGTIDSLIDILVFGIDKLRTPTTDSNGVISLSSTGGRPLNLDIEEYRETFFATYRTFATPLTILDLLRKRYLAAPNASQDYLTLSSSKPFPSWNASPSTDITTELDWNQISLMRFAILETLRFWLENHINDFLDDDDLYSSTHAFFLSVELIEQANFINRPQDDLLLEEVKSLKQRFFRKCLRPLVRCRKAVVGQDEILEKTSEISFDLLSVTDLVDKLDGIACEITRDVTANDLLRYSELVEMKTLSDPSALYSSRLLSKIDDDELIITDPYSHLKAIGLDSIFVKRMPLSLQFGLRIHTLLRRWVLCHLIDPTLTVGQRKHRMLKALDVVEVCRSRMSGVSLGDEPESQKKIQDPSLASFVERAVISAIVAPESRAYSSAWISVQLTRNSNNCETLAGLLQSNLFVTDRTSTLDLAWLNERLIEIGTNVENYFQVDDKFSINFEKRCWIFNCIKNVLIIQPSQPLDQVHNTIEQMERQLTTWGHWGSKTLRDVANSENRKNNRSIKPFSKLVSLQVEKMKRDKQAKEFLAKGIKLEQQSRAQREKDGAKMNSEKTRSRRMTAIFRSVRPISTLPGADPSTISSPTVPSPEAMKNLNDWNPATKPYLVLALSGVEVHPVDNSQRSFVFELSTEDGQRSLFQAKSQEEMQKWIKELVGSGTQIAFRRATFLAQTPLFEEPDQESVSISPPKSKLATIPASSKGVFGLPLWQLVQREESTIPNVIEVALEFIEARGLTEVGIYRISGENRIVNEFKDSLNRGYPASSLFTPLTDVHNVTSLVKLYLRELPDPLIPHSFYDSFMKANNVEGYDERLYAIRDLVWKLPRVHFALLRRLCEHFDKVTDNEQLNAMHGANLALVFAPTLLQPPAGPNSFGISMTNLGISANLIKSLILQEGWIFGSQQEEEEEVEVLVDGHLEDGEIEVVNEVAPSEEIGEEEKVILQVIPVEKQEGVEMVEETEEEENIIKSTSRDSSPDDHLIGGIIELGVGEDEVDDQDQEDYTGSYSSARLDLESPATSPFSTTQTDLPIVPIVETSLPIIESVNSLEEPSISLSS